MAERVGERGVHDCHRQDGLTDPCLDDECDAVRGKAEELRWSVLSGSKPRSVGGGVETTEESMNGPCAILRWPRQGEDVWLEARDVLRRLREVEAALVDPERRTRRANASIAAREELIRQAHQGSVAHEVQVGSGEPCVQDTHYDRRWQVVVLCVAPTRLGFQLLETVSCPSDGGANRRLVEVEIAVELVYRRQIRLQRACMNFVLVTQEGEVAEHGALRCRERGEAILGAEVEEALHLSPVADPSIVSPGASHHLLEPVSKRETRCPQASGVLRAELVCPPLSQPTTTCQRGDPIGSTLAR